MRKKAVVVMKKNEAHNRLKTLVDDPDELTKLFQKLDLQYSDLSNIYDPSVQNFAKAYLDSRMSSQ